jgi:hypothetical protein
MGWIEHIKHFFLYIKIQLVCNCTRSKALNLGFERDHSQGGLWPDKLVRSNKTSIYLLLKFTLMFDLWASTEAQ